MLPSRIANVQISLKFQFVLRCMAPNSFREGWIELCGEELESHCTTPRSVTSPVEMFSCWIRPREF